MNLFLIILLIYCIFIIVNLLCLSKKINNKYKILSKDSDIKFWKTHNFSKNIYNPDKISETLLYLNNDLREIEGQIIKKSKNKFFYQIKLCDYEKAIESISYCYSLIYNIDNHIEKIPHLNELNDRYTFFYRYMNENEILKIKNIPIIQISKHHHAVEWIYKYIKQDIGTILHIDSHADLNPMINKSNFLEKFMKSENITKKQYQKFYKYINDIGCVLVPMLLPYEKNNGIVWMTPDWVTEPFNNSKVYLKKNDDYVYYYGGSCPKYTIKEDDIDYEDGDKIVNFTTSNVKYMNKVLHKISNNYVLNLDLDYFVTFGSPSYGTEGNDAISDSRTLLDLGFTMKNFQEFEYKNIELENEIKLIKKRIDDFLIIIKLLKKMGKQPKIIIICDSTMINYSIYNEKFIKNESELIHEYTPKYLCFWIHNLIVKNLKKILDE